MIFINDRMFFKQFLSIHLEKRTGDNVVKTDSKPAITVLFFNFTNVTEKERVRNSIETAKIMIIQSKFQRLT